MAEPVKIRVEMEDWLHFWWETNEGLGYGPEYSWEISVDPDFLEEYRKALQVILNFQRYASEKVREVENG